MPRRSPPAAASRLLGVGSVLAGALLLVLAAVGAAVGAATSATSATTADADGWTLSWARPLAGEELRPGATTEAELRLVNERDVDLEVELGVAGVVDDENGCLRQELHSPREDCAAGEASGAGELSGQLLLSARTAGEVVLEDTVASLGRGDRRGAVQVPAGARVDLDVELSLPASSTNETMSDVVDFAVTAVASGEPGPGADGAVLGASVEAGTGGAAGDQGAAPPRSAGDLLPATGSGVGLGLLALGLALVGFGAATWRRGRRGSERADRVPTDG